MPLKRQLDLCVFQESVWEYFLHTAGGAFHTHTFAASAVRFTHTIFVHVNLLKWVTIWGVQSFTVLCFRSQHFLSQSKTNIYWS